MDFKPPRDSQGSPKPSRSTRDSEAKRLRARLQELEQTLEAIRSGGIDALIVTGQEGDRVFTLQGAEHPYRVLVESFGEGAATLDNQGDLLYANRCFSDMLGVGLKKLIGTSLRERIRGIDLGAFDNCLEHSSETPEKLTCDLLTNKGTLLPVHLSFSPLRGEGLQARCVIATDLTDQKRREAELALEVAHRKRAEDALRREEKSLRELSARLLRLQDEERRRLARDLHDSTGQKLVALTLELGMLEAHLPGVAPEISQIISECRQLAEDATADIRTLSYLLHPPLLDEAGLTSAAQWFVDGFARRSKIKVELDIPNDLGRMQQELELTLFRILQESLTNVHRHSGSPTAWVKLAIESNRVILEVKDEGQMKVMSTNDGEQSIELLGVGVRGMQERVRQLGGSLELQSSTKGTIMKAILPYSRAENA